MKQKQPQYIWFKRYKRYINNKNKTIDKRNTSDTSDKNDTSDIIHK